MKVVALLFVLCFVSLSLAKNKLSYTVGETFSAKFHSEVSSQGQGQQSGTTSDQKSSISLDADLLFSCVSVDSKSFMLQMNMTNVLVSTYDGSKYVPVQNDGSLESAFATPFYVNINQSGEIEYVCVNENNTEVLSIKKGIVASLQTRLVEAGESKIHTEVDAIGVHNSTFTIQNASGSKVALKSYTVSDFNTFPDSSIQKDEIQLKGYSQVQVSSEGRFEVAISSVWVQPFQPKQTTTEVLFEDDMSASLSAVGKNVLEFSASILSSDVTTYKSFAHWQAQHPEYAREPLTSSVKSGWKLNIDHKNPKNTHPSSSNPDFPYNKDVPVNKMLGSKTVGLSFNADLFAGTNFDCQHDYFNYKLFGEAQAQVYLFGSPHNLLDVKFEYGRDNGTSLDDAFTVTLWNKPIYNKDFPVLTDCQEHDYNIAHADPGFSVQHTVHVSIVPITFAVNGDANLGLKWGYTLCDSKLDVLAQIIPSVGVNIGGAAEFSVLIAKAGVHLGAGLTSDIKPQVYLHGSKCLLGFDVLLDAEPFKTSMDAYYQTRHCHWFKCSWGDKHDKTFFSYSAPQYSNVNLFQKDFDIKDLVKNN